MLRWADRPSSHHFAVEDAGQAVPNIRQLQKICPMRSQLKVSWPFQFCTTKRIHWDGVAVYSQYIIVYLMRHNVYACHTSAWSLHWHPLWFPCIKSALLKWCHWFNGEGEAPLQANWYWLLPLCLLWLQRQWLEITVPCAGRLVQVNNT